MQHVMVKQDLRRGLMESGNWISLEGDMVSPGRCGEEVTIARSHESRRQAHNIQRGRVEWKKSKE